MNGGVCVCVYITNELTTYSPDQFALTMYAIVLGSQIQITAHF